MWCSTATRPLKTPVGHARSYEHRLLAEVSVLLDNVSDWGTGSASLLLQTIPLMSLHPTNHMLGHAAAVGQPLSGHRTALSPVPSTCVDVVVGVLHVGMGGITVATTVLLFPTNPVT